MAKPAIILVRPQLGENIGKAARAMLNFGLEDLRLVAPRDGWPNRQAHPPASGADQVLKNAKVFETTEAAIADLTHVFAATVRERGMDKPVVSAAEAGATIRSLKAGKAGILFGRESSGLANDDVVLADTILTVPVNPGFASLNIAVAVALVAYECFHEGREVTKTTTRTIADNGPGPAAKQDLIALFGHLEGELDRHGYFHPPERKPPMVRSLRNLLQSAGLSKQQVATLRGVIKALSSPGKNK